MGVVKKRIVYDSGEMFLILRFAVETERSSPSYTMYYISYVTESFEFFELFRPLAELSTTIRS